MKGDVDGTEHLLYYFAISPFLGCSADVNLQQHLDIKSIGKLKTWPTQVVTHCFLTEDMYLLLKVYVSNQYRPGNIVNNT